MPTDFSLELRQSIVKLLTADAGVTALVSATRIYGEKSPPDPTYPFIRYGMPMSTPFEATGWDGSEHRVTLHVFAKGPFTDDILRARKAVIAAMSRLAVPPYSVTENQYRHAQLFRDSSEESIYHDAIEFDVIVVQVNAAEPA